MTDVAFLGNRFENGLCYRSHSGILGKAAAKKLALMPNDGIDGLLGHGTQQQITELIEPLALDRLVPEIGDQGLEHGNGNVAQVLFLNVFSNVSLEGRKSRMHENGKGALTEELFRGQADLARCIRVGQDLIDGAGHGPNEAFPVASHSENSRVGGSIV